MGLRCLLGHDFNEPEVEREREEDGNEVVTTVREVKTCSRCGETQIVSENTEVTTMERLAEAAAAESTVRAGTGSSARGSANDEDVTSVHPDADHGGDTDTAIHGSGAVEESEATGGIGTSAEAGEAPEAGDGEYPAPTDGEDAEIIDAGPSDGEGSAARTSTAGAGDADAAWTDSPATTADDPATAGGGTAADDEDAELVDDDPHTSWPGESTADASADGQAGSEAAPEDGSESRPGDGPESPPDDGVILDDETDEDPEDRERGAWPEMEADDDPASEPAPWPDQRGEDEGWNATVDEGGDEAADVEFGGGLTPETAVDHDDEGVEFVEAPERGADAVGGQFEPGDGESDSDDPTGSGITHADGSELRTSARDVETEYYCPECEMTRAADGNSMRAGDICPECKRGYVDERPI